MPQDPKNMKNAAQPNRCDDGGKKSSTTPQKRSPLVQSIRQEYEVQKAIAMPPRVAASRKQSSRFNEHKNTIAGDNGYRECNKLPPHLWPGLRKHHWKKSTSNREEVPSQPPSTSAATKAAVAATSRREGRMDDPGSGGGIPSAVATNETKGLRQTRQEADPKRAAAISQTTPSTAAAAAGSSKGLRRSRVSWQSRRQSPSEVHQVLSSLRPSQNIHDNNSRHESDNNVGSISQLSSGTPSILQPQGGTNTVTTCDSVTGETRVDESPRDVDNRIRQVTPSTTETEEMPRAVLVVEDDIPEGVDMEYAEQVDLGMQQKKHTQRREARRRLNIILLGASGIGLIIIVSVIIAALMLQQNSSSQREDTSSSAASSSSTTTASVVPSQPPSPPHDPTEQSSLLFLKELLPKETWDIIQQGNPSAPQYQAYEWLKEYPDGLSQIPDWHIVQKFALATFFYAFGGTTWPELTQDRWLRYDRHECDWFSASFLQADVFGWDPTPTAAGDQTPNVTVCNADFRYTILSLNSLYALDAVTGDYTGIPAILPPEMALLTSLETMAVESSILFSPLSDILVPTILVRLPNLTTIELPYCTLTGTIPSDLGLLTELENLNLAFNSLEGIIPSEIAKLEHLEHLNLNFNEGISGSLPKLSTTLKVLKIRGLSLTGTLPTELGTLEHLLQLDASFNNFHGSLPREIAEMEQLQELQLNLNSDMSGTLPFEIFDKMTNLKVLGVRRTSISGSIPPEIGQLSMLEDIRFSENWMTGALPISDMANLSNLKYWGASFNFFTGSISSSIGLLTNLEELWLEKSMLSGCIPTELGLLVSLSSLGLNNDRVDEGPCERTTNLTVSQAYLCALQSSGNRFPCPIPSEMGRLVNIKHLFLQELGLTTALPSTLGLLTSLEMLNLSSNELMGPIPSELVLLNHSTNMSLTGNHFSGVLPQELCPHYCYMVELGQRLHFVNDSTVDCTNCRCQ